MNTRKPTIHTLLALVPVAGLVAACGSGTLGDGVPAAAADNSGGGTSSGASTSSGGSSGSTSSASDVFSGAPAFASQTGRSTATCEGHSQFPSCLPTGQDCASCHEHSGAFGGTVYTDWQGTKPAPGVEVRIVDANGTATSTHTDSNGNFLIGGNRTGIVYPVSVGVRDATTSRLMATQLTQQYGGGCAAANCHKGSYASGTALFQGPYWAVHVP